MENTTKTVCEGSPEQFWSSDEGICPKCETSSVIEDMGDLGQCQNCGLLIGNNLKSEILETRQTVLAGYTVLEEQSDLYE